MFVKHLTFFSSLADEEDSSDDLFTHVVFSGDSDDGHSAREVFGRGEESASVRGAHGSSDRSHDQGE